MIAAITAIYGHLSIVEQKWQFLPLISVGILGVTTLLCVRSNGKEVQRTVFLGKKMTKESRVRDDVVESWTEAPQDVFYMTLINEYVLCLEKAERVIEKKSSSLTKSIVCFFVGCITFPVFMVLELWI